MPHINLEYSDNIVEKNDLVPILRDAQLILEKALPAKLASFKSRAIPCEACVVGDGAADNAFVHMHVKIMAGRSRGTLDAAGGLLMDFMTQAFKETINKRKLSMSIEIEELAASYYKSDPVQIKST
jgi:5-carboxymethyl-2-hydroxymuconate isomerase